MYAANSILILLTALSAGALALPTNTTGMIHVRGSPASIAGFSDQDCYGEPIPGETAADGTTVLPKPEDGEKLNCITFNTPATYIGVNFGNTFSMRAFGDAHCNDYLPYVSFPGTDHDCGTKADAGCDEHIEDDHDPHKWKGAKVCVNQLDTFKQKIGSIRFYSHYGGGQLE